MKSTQSDLGVESVDGKNNNKKKTNKEKHALHHKKKKKEKVAPKSNGCAK